MGPLPANILLHTAFDVWAHLWRQKQARGQVPIVRCADDFVPGFRYPSDAQAM